MGDFLHGYGVPSPKQPSCLMQLKDHTEQIDHWVTTEPDVLTADPGGSGTVGPPAQDSIPQELIPGQHLWERNHF